MKYKNVVVSGTFDGLHVGHKALIKKAFEMGEHVYVAITSDVFVQTYKSNAAPIHSQKDREDALSAWLSKEGLGTRATIVHIHDPFGPTIPKSEQNYTPIPVEAIIVTSQTHEMANKINGERMKAGWKPLDIVEVALVPAQDGEPVSSTRIRKNEIDTTGQLIMPDDLRSILGKPFGSVLGEDDIPQAIQRHLDDCIVCIGDISTKKLLENGCVPRLSIIDGVVGRKPYIATHELLQQRDVRITKVISGPGHISSVAMEHIQAWRAQWDSADHTPFAIFVTGEEDLLTLPAILYAPEGAVVYYGQPPMVGQDTPQSNHGLVEVVVTDMLRAQVKKLLSRFHSS
jgi:pantetheine-phosphate adenylyltransferase